MLYDSKIIIEDAFLVIHAHGWISLVELEKHYFLGLRLYSHILWYELAASHRQRTGLVRSLAKTS